MLTIIQKPPAPELYANVLLNSKSSPYSKPRKIPPTKVLTLLVIMLSEKKLPGKSSSFSVSNRTAALRAEFFSNKLFDIYSYTEKSRSSR